MVVVFVTARPIPGADVQPQTPSVPGKATPQPKHNAIGQNQGAQDITSGHGQDAGPSKAQEIWDSIVKFVVATNAALWKWVDTLPISRSIFISIVIGCTVFLFLCCCCVCCRYCCRIKQTRRKMKGKLNLKREHLFGPNYAERIQPRFDEFDYDVESTKFDASAEVKMPKIKFSLLFDSEENIVDVTVHEGKDLPAADIDGTSDAYVKVSLKPVAKKTHQTKVKKDTLHPKFEEVFQFHKIIYTALRESELHLKVYDDDPGRDSVLGEVIVPIQNLELKPIPGDMNKSTVTEWRVLFPEFKAEKGSKSNLGHICMALAYAPNKSLLVVCVMRCKDLLALDDSGFSDPYVILFLLQDGKKLKKRKTTVKLRTLNPVYNESFIFLVDFENIEQTSLHFLVADYDKGEPGTPIGQCVVGDLGNKHGKKHWSLMRKSPGKPVANWHSLKPLPTNN